MPLPRTEANQKDHLESPWTHNIDLGCWNIKTTQGKHERVWGDRQPLKDKDNPDVSPEDKCCYCGSKNTDGVYYREDPATAHEQNV